MSIKNKSDEIIRTDITDEFQNALTFDNTKSNQQNIITPNKFKSSTINKNKIIGK